MRVPSHSSDVLEWCVELDASGKNMLVHADNMQSSAPELAEAQRSAALQVLGAVEKLRRIAQDLRDARVYEYGSISRSPGYWCAKCGRERHNTRNCPVCDGPITLPPSAQALAPQTGLGAEVQADVVPPTLLGHHGRAEGVAPAQVDRTHLTVFNETAYELWFRATWSPTDRKLSITVEPIVAPPAPPRSGPKNRLKP